MGRKLLRGGVKIVGFLLKAGQDDQVSKMGILATTVQYSKPGGHR